MYASEFDLQPAPSYLADPLRDASRHDSICFASIVRNLLAWLLIPTPSRPTGIGVLFGFLGFRYAFSISLQAVVLQKYIKSTTLLSTQYISPRTVMVSFPHRSSASQWPTSPC